MTLTVLNDKRTNELDQSTSAHKICESISTLKNDKSPGLGYLSKKMLKS